MQQNAFLFITRVDSNPRFGTSIRIVGVGSMKGSCIG